jgi:AraC-like DNA-binding protein
VNVGEDNFPLILHNFNTCNFNIHWHRHTELLYFTESDNVRLYCDGEEFVPEKGELVAVNPNILHRGAGTSVKTKYICIMLPPTFFNFTGENRRYVFQKRIRGDRYIGQLAEKIYATYHARGVGYRYGTLALCYELIDYMIRNYADGSMDRNGFAARNDKLEKFNNIIDYMHMHYNEPLNTAQAAELAHLSECYFCRLFKMHTQESFTAYLNNIRIQKSIDLLKNSKMSITAVAATVGFNDVNYFCRIFRRIIGNSPQQYRNL